MVVTSRQPVAEEKIISLGHALDIRFMAMAIPHPEHIVCPGDNSSSDTVDVADLDVAVAEIA